MQFSYVLVQCLLIGMALEVSPKTLQHFGLEFDEEVALAEFKLFSSKKINSQDKIRTYIREFLKTKPSDDSIVSDKCSKDLLHWFDNTSVSHSPSPKWQQQMSDSSFAMQSGILEINTYWLGDMTQCTKIEVWTTSSSAPPASVGTKEPDFYGKYCFGSIGLLNESISPFRIGVCIPSTCQAAETKAIVNQISRPLIAHFEDHVCQTINNSNEWDQTAIILTSVIVFLMAVVAMATLYEIYGRLLTAKTRTSKEEGLAGRIILSLSALKNGKKLLSTSVHDRDHLLSLNGLKILSMTWIIVGHMNILLSHSLPIKNPKHSIERAKNFSNQLLLGGEFAVDTFFCTTGFLLVYIFLKELESRKGKFNFLTFVVNRYMRLTPALAMTIAFMSGPYPFLTTGPIWAAAKMDSITCRETWWKHLLYISNYRIGTPKCLPQLWYLCVDMSFYFASPILLLPLYWKPVIGYVTWTILLFLSLGLTAYRIHFHHLETFGEMNGNDEDRRRFLIEVYHSPVCRVHVFLVGMLFGYLYLRKGRSLTMRWPYVMAGWITVSGLMYALIFAVYPFNSGQRLMTRAEQLLYGTFSRLAWTACIGWIILTSATGYAGPVQKFLSWKMFVPLGRLSYSAYLVHFTVMMYYFANRRDSIYLDYYYINYLRVVMVALTLFFACCLSLVVEMPAAELQSMVRKKRQRNHTDLVTQEPRQQ